jgi:hypothetical protein
MNMNDINMNAQTVDQLGSVKAQIAGLKSVEDNLKSEIISMAAEGAATAFDGVLYRATVSFSSKRVTRWEDLTTFLAEQAGLTNDDLAKLKAKFTDTADGFPVVRVSARKS